MSEQVALRKSVELKDINSDVSVPQRTDYFEDSEWDGHIQGKRVLRSPKSDTNSTKNALQSNRVSRQNPKKQRPGFFWTIAKATFEVH